MKYVEYINKLIKDEVLRADRMVIFGQNINAGSCLSGLTKNLKVKKGNLIINTPNCENSLVGIGFGAMMNGVSAAFMMKQQDFLLLGIDQLVNTYNIIRQRSAGEGSFTIMTIIVDNGYEGPQSRLNHFGDFCSIAGIQGFTITNTADAKEIISSQFNAPGFRIIGISQRLFKQEIMEMNVLSVSPDRSVFQYAQGKQATIICFNLSLPYGVVMAGRLKEKGLSASLFSVNSPVPVNWDELVHDINKTGTLILIDDLKSRNLASDNLLVKVLGHCTLKQKFIIRRRPEENVFSPHHDQMVIDYDHIVGQLATEWQGGLKSAEI
ncbi:MAG: hypothetical protein HQL12_01910 [Candidatus Omnitrophica bacterium]|nr:hypothetical protein [Candidatus Omnitrophota bacterium]